MKLSNRKQEASEIVYKVLLTPNNMLVTHEASFSSYINISFFIIKFYQ